MKLVDSVNKQVLLGLIVPAMLCGMSTACSAQVTQSVVGSHESADPELAAAEQRVEQVKQKLDQARRQLEVAKVMVRSTEAEFKSVKADREALALRLQAQKIASSVPQPPTATVNVAPNANDQIRQVVIPPVAGANPSGGRLLPASIPVQPIPVQGMQAQAAQPLDFNAQSSTPATSPMMTPVVPDKADGGAPIPSNQQVAAPLEPNAVP